MRNLDDVESDVAELIRTIYSTVLDGDEWQKVADQLVGLDPILKILIHVEDIDRTGTTASYSSNISDETVSNHVNYYSHINPWTERIATTPLGGICSVAGLASSEEFLLSEFYNDHARHEEDLRVAVGTVFAKGKYSIACVGLQLPNRYADAHYERALWILDRIRAHLVHAFWLARHNSFAPPETAVEHAAIATILLDRKGRVLRMNNQAQRFLQRADSPLSVNASGLFQMRDFSQQDRLQAMVLEAVASKGKAAWCAIRAEDGRPAFISLIPLLRVESNDALISAFIGSEEPAAVAYMVSADMRNEQIGKTLVSVFGLSPAEALVAGAFGVEGLSVHQIAAARGVGIHTVRHQLATAMEKLSVTRPADLVATLSPLAALQRESQSQNQKTQGASSTSFLRLS